MRFSDDFMKIISEVSFNLGLLSKEARSEKKNERWLFAIVTIPKDKAL